MAEQAVTLLSAPEKTGKTTLLSLLLDRRRAGGQLLGRDVYPGRTVLCTEEHDRLWALRQPPLDFGPELIFLRSQSEAPTRRRWARIINDLYGFSLLEEPLLVVIDSAVSFLPLNERRKQKIGRAHV